MPAPRYGMDITRIEPLEFFHYMVHQFSDLERKSIEPIALSVEDGKVRAMQRTII